MGKTRIIKNATRILACCSLGCEQQHHVKLGGPWTSGFGERLPRVVKNSMNFWRLCGHALDSTTRWLAKLVVAGGGCVSEWWCRVDGR
jgi:hypothetical protein